MYEEYDEDLDEYTPVLEGNLTSYNKRMSSKRKRRFDKDAADYLAGHAMSIDMLRVEGYDAYVKSYSEHDFIKTIMIKEIGFSAAASIMFDDIDTRKLMNDVLNYVFDFPKESYALDVTRTSREYNVGTFYMGLSENEFPLVLYVIDSQLGLIYHKGIENCKVFHEIMDILNYYSHKPLSKNKIYVIAKSKDGFSKTGFSVKRVKVNIEENYNDGFVDTSKKIVKFLNSKNTGLIILSGVAGTGKTTYIRYLSSKIKKNIIFIPPDMVELMTDPSFISFLMKNNNSVLIIEDAEPALKMRDHERSSAVSNVLNITDGLLSDCLNISIIATFNTEMKNIDNALLRKGRLFMNYTFNKLSVNKANALLSLLGKNITSDKPLTLGEIYNIESDNNAPTLSTHTVIGGFGKR